MVSGRGKCDCGVQRGDQRTAASPRDPRWASRRGFRPREARLGQSRRRYASKEKSSLAVSLSSPALSHSMGRNYWSLAVPRGIPDTSYTITCGAGCLSFSVPSGREGYEIESLFHGGPRLTLRSRLKSDNIFPALKKNKEIELTVTGRRTGKPLPRPVWFALRGTELLLLPVT